MHDFLSALCEMSLTASWLISVIIILRLFIKNAPKNFRCVLWLMAAVRLVCPFSFSGAISLVPDSKVVSDTVSAAFEQFDSVLTRLEAADTYTSPADAQTASALLDAADIACIIWAAGAAVLIIYAAVSYIRLHRKTRETIEINDGIWLCDRVSSPFVMGIFRPRIILPSDISLADTDHVIAHERAHIRRRDHIWKPLGFAVLTLHWFNPLVWAAYVLFCRDIELACDESVIKDMDIEGKKSYAHALLNCSAPRAVLLPAFGEAGAKVRIKNALNYKKPTAWAITAAVTLCIAVGIFFMTDPLSARISPQLDSFISQVILTENAGSRTPQHFACESHEVIGVKKDGDRTTVYALVYYHEYKCEYSEITSASGSYIPTAITVRQTDGGYVLEEYWIPGDGTRYAPDIKEKFPFGARMRALDSQRYVGDLRRECQHRAEQHFGAKMTTTHDPESFTTTAITADE